MEANNNKLGKQWALFLVMPLVSFVSAIKYADKRSGRNLIVVFCCLVGWLMSPYSETQDLFRYYQQFDSISSWSTTSYLAYLAEYLSFSTNVKDFYFETVTFLGSRITDNPHFYYLIFGLVFGLFYANSLSIMVSSLYRNDGRMDYFSGVFFFLIIFAIPFIMISSVRFWTAAWVGIYVLLKVFVEHKPGNLCWLLFAIFIHGTFLIFGVLVVLSFFLSRTEKFTYPLVILVYLSIPFSYLSFDAISLAYQYIPDFLENTTDYYVGKASEEAVEGTGFAWLAGIFYEAMHILDLVLIVLLTLNRKQTQDEFSKLYISLLVLLVFANFTSVVPSLGGRFFKIAQPILYFLCLFSLDRNKYNWLVKLVPFIYSFSFVYMFYHEFTGTIGTFSLFVPPFISLFIFL